MRALDGDTTATPIAGNAQPVEAQPVEARPVADHPSPGGPPPTPDSPLAPTATAPVAPPASPGWPVPPDESDRLRALRALQMLDTPHEERLDRITRLAQKLLDAPIVFISLVDADRQWFKSCAGSGLTDTPRSASFCAYTIMGDELLEVPDARADPTFARLTTVTGPPYVVFYAGVPLRSPEGRRVGSLCVIDHRPRALTADQKALLGDLGAWAELELGVVGLAGQPARPRRCGPGWRRCSPAPARGCACSTRTAA